MALRNFFIINASLLNNKKALRLSTKRFVFLLIKIAL